MNKRSLILILLLAGCATYTPPEQIAQQEAYRLCANQFPSSEKRTEKQNEEFNKCRVEKYATLLPAYTQQAQARQIAQQMQMQAAIQNLGNSMQQQQQQDLENKVWAANPEFAACKYRGICNQNKSVRTTCRRISNTVQCDSY